MAKEKKNKKHESRKTFTLFNHEQTEHAQFDVAESYRQIRTNIEFSSVNEIKAICLTSTQPKEAKSTTAINLAYIFATKYEKVLIIDGDLRKPQLHNYLQLTNEVGLSNALRDFSKTHKLNKEFFQSKTDDEFVGQLDVLTGGAKVPNPAEVLSSDTFKDFIKALKAEYDFIIIDCPPVGAVTDAIPVGHAVDGTLFIYSTQDTNRKAAKAALDLLRQNNVHILGSVLTKVDTSTENYNYGGYGYY